MVVYVRGVVLAGGTGTRLYPLTKVTNKHLLPVYDEPMIYKPLKTLINSGIKDITIVLGGESVGDFIKLLGDGSELGCRLSYVYQQQAGGIAEALYLTKPILEGCRLAVILGDNIFEDTFPDEVREFEKEFYDCCLFLKDVPDPQRFGVAEICDNIIVNIEEKPKIPKSNLAVTGLYFFDESIFDVIEKVLETKGYSKRGELEITDVNNFYIKNGLPVYCEVNGFWSDAGTFDTLMRSSIFSHH